VLLNKSKFQACLKYGDVFDWLLTTRVFQNDFTDVDDIVVFLNELDQLAIIRDAGWIRPLLDLLTHNNELITTLVLSMITTLATTEPFPQILRALGGIPASVQLFTHSSATLQISTAMVIKELCSTDIVNKHVIREEGGLQSLLARLSDSDVNVRKACLEAPDECTVHSK
jgi:hypothetical protein